MTKAELLFVAQFLATEEGVGINLAKFANMCIEWGQQHPHWISVEDELPKINPNGSEWEYSDDVIVVLKDGSIAVGRYERDNSTAEHYWWLYGVDQDLIVTHWMHSPQPPKGGEQ